MRRLFIFGALILQALSLLAQPAPYSNTTCDSATQICSGQNYVYPAWYNNHPSETGPYYGCLSSQPDPAWFYFVIGNPGDIHIYMFSTPNRDIDFICWGPYDSLSEGCDGGLTQAKVIDCSYSSSWNETCDVPNGIAGKYYVLLITNFSKLECTVSLSQSYGIGTMVCIQPPAISSNSPLCAGQTIQLTAGSVSGGTYQWTGPNGFSSSLQNPVIPDATTSHSGVYTLVVSVGSVVLSPVTLSITVNPAPAFQIVQDTSICSGSTIDLGGPSMPGYNYTWTSSPPGFSSSLSNPAVAPTVNTKYYLSVTSDQGCNGADSVTVQVKPVPYASVVPNSTVCQGTSVPLGGPPNPSNTYAWSSNPPGFTSTSSNPTVTANITTTYTLTVTNNQGCSRTYQVVLTVNPLPAANTGPAQSGCIGTVFVLGSSAITGNTYTWTSDPTGFTSALSNPTVTPIITTTFTLTETITATSCSKTNTVLITIHPMPAAITGPSVTLCQGSSATLGTTAVPGNTYSWTSTPSGFTSSLANPTVTPSATTVYHLTETTSFGCTATNSVTVTVNPLPQAYTGPNTPVCKGSFVTLGGAPVPGNTYQWSSIPSGFSSAISNPQVYPNVNTTYTLVETISSTNCSASNSVTVTVNPLPVTQVIPNSSICAGTSIFIGGPSTPGNTYQWTSIPYGFLSASANPQVSPLITTTYFLTQTISATGCTKLASVTITVNPTPAAYTGPDQTICAGSQVTIGGPPVSGNGYSWTSNPSGFTSQVSNPLVSPSVTTTYTLVETHLSSGCFASHFVKITITPLPQVSLSPFTPLCKDAPPLTLSGGNPPGGTYSGTGVTSNVFYPSVVGPGNYLITYTLIDPQGCSGTAFQSILVLNKPRISGTINYLNGANTPLDSTRIRILSQTNVPLDSVNTNNTGNYAFNCLNPGTYKIRSSCKKKWGGGNSLDALLIARYSVGLISFNSMQMKAADVNASGSINAGDSYLVMRRFAGMVTTFPAGDWCYSTHDTVIVNTSDIIVQVKALCIGDVNGSYSPYTANKSSLSPFLFRNSWILGYLKKND